MRLAVAFAALVALAAVVAPPSIRAQPPTGATPTRVDTEENRQVFLEVAEWSAPEAGTYFSLAMAFLSPRHVREVVLSIEDEAGATEMQSFIIRPMLRRSGSSTVSLTVPRIRLEGTGPGSHIIATVKAFRFSSTPSPMFTTRAEVVVHGAPAGAAPMGPPYEDGIGGSLVARKVTTADFPGTDPSSSPPWVVRLEGGMIPFAPENPVRVYVHRQAEAGPPVQIPALIERMDYVDPPEARITLYLAASLEGAIVGGIYTPRPGDSLEILTNRVDFDPGDTYPGDEDAFLFPVLRVPLR